MDPVSATLAAIAFATAVKDLVELGQKIHESFAKVSSNYENARSVAEDIKEMVDEIEQFCEENKEALANMKDFRLALVDLLAKFKNFEASILPLLPKTGGRKRDRFVRAWDAWRKNNKVQDGILELQGAIVKVIRKYMWKSTLRTEVKLDEMHRETSQGLTGISHDLERDREALGALRRDVTVMRIATTETSMAYASHQSSAGGSDEFDRQVVMFAQSTGSASVPLLRTPNVITEELMTAAYIKLQINHIAVALDKLSTLPAPTSTSSVIGPGVIDFQSHSSVQQSMHTTHLRRLVVRQILDIRDRLDSGNLQTMSMTEGADALNTLSLGLGALHMGPESIQIGDWATKLIRTLVDSSDADPNLCAALGLYLINQSVQYYYNRDQAQSLQVIEKAHEIALDLCNRFAGETRFYMLYNSVLLQYALLVDAQKSSEILAEVVQTSEAMLNIHVFTLPAEQMPESPPETPWSFLSVIDSLFSSDEIPIEAISHYALALQRLGAYLFKDGNSESAVAMQLFAIAIRRKMVSIHGHQYKPELANALRCLVDQNNVKDHIAAEVVICLTDEGIQLYRELTDCNPVSYARDLIGMLWVKATTLESLERDTEAISAWEEVVSLAGQLIEDSTLITRALDQLSNQFRRVDRDHDAARTATRAIEMYKDGPGIQAMRYGMLSMDLGRLRRYKEATEAAQTSIALHQSTMMKDPGTLMPTFAQVLSSLAHSLAASGRCSEALSAWRNSANMLTNFLLTNPDTSSPRSANYLAALRTHVRISYVIEDADARVEISCTTVKYFNQVSEMNPQHLPAIADLLWAEFSHAYNLLGVGRLQDAQRYIEDWINRRRSMLEATSDSDIIRWHAVMIGLKSIILDAQGRTEEASLANQIVYNIIRTAIDAHHMPVLDILKPMHRSVQIQTNLGNNEAALKVAEEALQLSRDSKPEPSARQLVRSLHAVAYTALLCRDYQRATEVAFEGGKICGTPNWQNNETEFDSLLRPSLLTILSSAEANLGNYSVAMEYAKRAVQVSLDIKDIRMEVSTTTAEESYIETRGNLANILLVTGDLVQARQICVERRAYFFKRVDIRMGEYRDLVPILRMLGILCCSEGRHDEGNDVAQELLRIVKTLGNAFPSLQKQVKVRLCHQAQVPMLKVLNDMYLKLDCQHQTEVASLVSN